MQRISAIWRRFLCRIVGHDWVASRFGFFCLRCDETVPW
jgi:hypothetical protein